MMRKFLLLQIITFNLYSIFSQNQVNFVFSGSAYVVLNSSSKVVIESTTNPNNSIISNSNGGFISENENNQVILSVGGNLGSYKIPFVSPNSLISIPLTFDVTSSGAGSGRIRFATYGCPTWNNNLYKPSDVTHMNDYNTGVLNNSDHVIDRFWIIDAENYSTKPDGTLKLTYLDNEISALGNSITEFGIGAQRFNSSTSQWGDYLPQGTVDVVLNTLSNIPVASEDFFRSWTISETLIPLADYSVNIGSYCDDDHVIVQWEIGFDISVSRFEIEVFDGEKFVNSGTVEAGTDLSYQLSFPFQDELTYRLVMVDFDGNKTYSVPMVVLCDAESEPQLSYNSTDNSWWFIVDSKWEENQGLQLFDFSGKLLSSQNVELIKGQNAVKIPTEFLKQGAYYITIMVNSKVQFLRFNYGK